MFGLLVVVTYSSNFFFLSVFRQGLLNTRCSVLFIKLGRDGSELNIDNKVPETVKNIDLAFYVVQGQFSKPFAGQADLNQYSRRVTR